MRTFAVVLFALAAFGQDAVMPKFEVASIKPAPPLTYEGVNAGKPGVRMDDAFVHIGYRTPKELIRIAYRLDFLDQVVGRDLPNTNFDIEAKIPAGSDKSQMPEMLRSLLLDRFGLEVHRESRPIGAYVLTVKNQALLDRHRSQPQPPGVAPSRWGDSGSNREQLIRGGTLALGARILTGVMRMPVLDESGLTDRFDLTFDMSLDRTGPDPDLIVHSLADQGLKLELKKTPMDTVVVDKIDKVPSGN